MFPEVVFISGLRDEINAAIESGDTRGLLVLDWFAAPRTAHTCSAGECTHEPQPYSVSVSMESARKMSPSWADTVERLSNQMIERPLRWFVDGSR